MRHVLWIGLLLQSWAIAASDISVFGLGEGRAVVSYGGGKVRVLRPGDTLTEGVKLLAADRESALFLVHGHKHSFTIGQAITTAQVAGKTPELILTADPSGHFFAQGSVNGGTLRFLVDTGATHIFLNASDARRLGVNYLKGQPGYSSTAGGTIRVWRVKLDEVRIGDLSARSVDAVVSEKDAAPFALLGMSFLQRMHMNRDGDRLTLSQRF